MATHGQRKTDLPDLLEELGLVDTAGAAAMLDVKRETVLSYRWRDDGFPQPVAQAGGRPLWRKEQITGYIAARAAARRGAAGRPPRAVPESS